MKGKATLAEEFSRPEMAAMGVDLPHRAVVDALNLKFPLRPYQREALRRLELYMSRLSEGEHPDQLLFHMATGSGKTLIMGGAILQLYRRGYRRFVFLVDSTNIIEKTKDNFLNPQSQKFLFRSPLYLDDKRVSIAETANFQAIDPHGVNILFTTVQGLHSQLSTPRENMLTIEDFALHPTVFISDEAHHINAATKKSSHTHKNPKPTDARTWEESVDRVFRSHARNVLLEFTATAPLDHPQVAKKYRDKIIMDYSLKQFRRDGYSKEIKVLQSDLPPFDRALQAAVLSVYRQRLFA
ncbi:MAG TPA: DEAD/DEAH box helicase family protein, partial [Cryomorphaceae bacterium]|nr:DEAD/DEAH box helicase family protein [Cryomorphaceae bacterium]